MLFYKQTKEDVLKHFNSDAEKGLSFSRVDELKENNQQKVNQDKKTKDKSKAQKALPILVVAVVSLVIILDRVQMCV